MSGAALIVVFIDSAVICILISEHPVFCESVLCSLSYAGIWFKLKKSKFYNDKIAFIGHRIKTGILDIFKKAVEFLRGRKHPTSIKEFKYF